MIGHLYDIFAEKWLRPGGQVYLYADPHFSDLDCYRMRFPNDNIGAYGSKLDYVAAKDQMQIDNINKMCHKCDTLIILGDVGNIECIKQLKAGRKVLIMGNHDAGASNYKKHTDWLADIDGKHVVLDQHFIDTHTDAEIIALPNFEVISYNLFDEVYEGCLQISPKIILSHEPIEYYPYCINIHGHDHMCEQTDGHLNVIAEKINYTPICLKAIIDSGILKIACDIHRETINYAIEKKKRKSNPMEDFQRNL